MIGWLARFLFARLWGTVVLGFLVLNVAWLPYATSQLEQPERAALDQFDELLDGGFAVLVFAIIWLIHRRRAPSRPLRRAGVLTQDAVQ
ncbi:MAG: hypothetical protein J2P50_06235 [Hyphomicrobiaceae bacterium]|nr:hypothetical protein [Hyphomicrobiaceae bacterium]